MFEIPLFPLDLVLFPGAPVHLHIFEERYKQMIGYCQETGAPFGVVLIRRGEEAGGPLAEPHTVGCSAQIAHLQMLAQGRMNLVALGKERFRILGLKRDRPYLVGVVEPFPLVIADGESLRREQERLRPRLERYVRLLSQDSDLQIDFHRLAQEPLIYINVAAMLLQVPADDKQELLEMEEAIHFARALQTLYRRELALLPAMLQKRPAEEVMFSSN